MKQLVITVLIFLGVIDIAAFYYLIKKQESAQARLETNIQKDIDERWQIASNVRDQVETKKQARDFIARIDYENEMRGYNQKLEDYKASIEEENKNSEERINSLEAAHKQLNELAKQIENQSDQKLDKLKAELEALNKNNAETLDELKVLNKQVKAKLIKIEDFYSRKVESLEKRVSELSLKLLELSAKPENVPLAN
jgi:DNA repair exonuclease SbcCD ATPase subunit